jgi:hypothetical protein
MRKWSDGDLFNLRHGGAWSGYLTISEAAADHIEAMQNAVKELRSWYWGNYGVQETISSFFWPKEEDKKEESMPDDPMGLAIDRCQKELEEIRKDIAELRTKREAAEGEIAKKTRRKLLLENFIKIGMEIDGIEEGD